MKKSQSPKNKKLPKKRRVRQLIILLEDEKIIAGLLEDKIKEEGYRVKVARDGRTGLELILKLKPDLVLLDIILPRMNGFQVLEKLSKAKLIPQLPVVIVSNSGQPVVLERAMKLGIRDYLIKVNFNPREVVAKVNQILRPGENGEEDSKEKEVKEKKKKKGNGKKKDAPRTSKNIHVLIVEDEVLLTNLLERGFRQKEYIVHKATDVTQAKSVLTKQKIDVILLDMVLPGTDGFSFLKEIKQSDQWKDIPVVILSNLGQHDEVKKGLDMGAIGYMIKANTSPSDIVKKVETFIKK